MDKDIEFLNTVLNVRSKNDLYNNFFCWLYPFTNENIRGYYSKINFLDKDVISVTSSGDHLLNALLLGAKNVDAFDINPLAKYYSELKVASVKTLSLEEFLLFLYNGNMFRIPKYFMSDTLYNKVREKLDGKYREFWDYVFNNYSPKSICKSRLFTRDFIDIRSLLIANMYLDEKNYYELREILNRKKINYYDCSIDNLTSIGKKYDVILFSNIPSFSRLTNKSKKQYLLELKNIVDSIKNEDAKVALCYLYSSIIDIGSGDAIYDTKGVRCYFKPEDYEYIEIDCASDLSKTGVLKRISDTYDKVIISK